MASSWYTGIRFIKELRRELANEIDLYIPIHLFGCFDPKSLIYFFLSGADIFDGLTWLRYFIYGNTTMYVREYESYLSYNQRIGLRHLKLSIIKNNINELNRLRKDLTYTIISGDESMFVGERQFIDSIATEGSEYR